MEVSSIFYVVVKVLFLIEGGGGILMMSQQKNSSLFLKLDLSFTGEKMYLSSFFILITYRGRWLYQYNEDDFFIKVQIVNKLFSNYKFISNSREANLIDSFSLF